MRPTFVVLHMTQGTTFIDTLTLKDKTTNLPIDLTGRSARMQVRRQDTDEMVLELTTANGRIGVLDNTGVVPFHIPADVLAAIPLEFDYETLVYDLEITHMDGSEEIVERPVRGVVVFWKELTV